MLMLGQNITQQNCYGSDFQADSGQSLLVSRWIYRNPPQKDTGVEGLAITMPEFCWNRRTCNRSVECQDLCSCISLIDGSVS